MLYIIRVDSCVHDNNNNSNDIMNVYTKHYNIDYIIMSSKWAFLYFQWQQRQATTTQNMKAITECFQPPQNEREKKGNMWM